MNEQSILTPREMLESAAAFIRTTCQEYDVVLADGDIDSTGETELTLTKINLICQDDENTFLSIRLAAMQDGMVNVLSVYGDVICQIPTHSHDPLSMENFITQQSIKYWIRCFGISMNDVDLRMSNIGSKPRAASVGAGKNKPASWHPPIEMPDGRTAWTNGKLMLIGTDAPYPNIPVIKHGNLTAEHCSDLVYRITSGPTSSVSHMYGVHTVCAQLVAMVTDNHVVTLNREYLALAKYWCGDNCTVLIDGTPRDVYMKSEDGTREAVVAGMLYSLKVDDLRAAAARMIARVK